MHLYVFHTRFTQAFNPFSFDHNRVAQALSYTDFHLNIETTWLAYQNLNRYFKGDHAVSSANCFNSYTLK